MAARSSPRFFLIGLSADLEANLSSELMQIGYEEILSAPTFRIALSIIKSRRFDCIIVDKSLGDGDGIVLAPIIKKLNLGCVQVLLTDNNRWATVEAASALGFHKVIDKEKSAIEITLELINLLNSFEGSTTPIIEGLSIRESEILRDLATGKRNIEIAKARHLSEATIKSHLASIYRKLGVRNRVEAIAVLNR